MATKIPIRREKRQKTSLYWNDIRFNVPDASKKPAKRGDPHPVKQILKGVSGMAHPGELLGIIGSSGGGKTSLLSIISGRITAIDSLGSDSSIEGQIEFADQIIDPSEPFSLEFLRQRISFVLQDDLLFGTEKVREAIQTSALLRLNGMGMDKSDKLAKAQNVIESLNLVKCSETLIGDARIRGVSGGERKRTSIAIEMVTDPQILMLDEPTSGLDSAIAYQTMVLLKRLAADQGRTVIASIHQPSSNSFALLDRVMILSGGHVVYHGRVPALADYLAGIGYKCPRYSNLADFVLQVVHEKPSWFIEKWNESSMNPWSMNASENEMIQSQGPEVAAEIAKMAKNERAKQNESSKNQNNLLRIPSDSLDDGGSVILSHRGSTAVRAEDVITGPRVMAPISDQIQIVTTRSFRLFIRNRRTTFVRQWQALFIGTLVGWVWFQLTPLNKISDNNEDKSKANAQSRFGAVFYAVIFATMNAITTSNLTFPSVRLVFQKERGSNWYLTTPWLVSKVIIDTVMSWLVLLPFSILIKFMIDLHIKWIELYGLLGLMAMVADSMGFFLGVLAKRPEIAMQVTPVTIIPMMVFSGYFVATSTIPVYLRWIKYINPFYYGTSIVAILEFDGLTAGERLLDQYGIRPSNLSLHVAMLFVLIIAFRILGTGSLIRMCGI